MGNLCLSVLREWVDVLDDLELYLLLVFEYLPYCISAHVHGCFRFLCSGDRYEVKVYTGTDLGAGTDANVKLRLYPS